VAHPDEPQRALAAPSAAAADPVAPAALTRRHAVRIALLFLAGLVIALLAYAAATVPGSWFPSQAPLTWPAAELRLARGDAGLSGTRWLVQPMPADGIAVLSVTAQFRASEYPAVAFVATGLPPDAEASVLWQNDVEPGRLHNRRLRIEAGELRPIVLAGDPAWIGRITGIALAIKGPLPQPVRVDAAAASPMGVPQVLGDRFSEWLAFNGWSGTSINTIVGGADVQDFPLPWVLAIAVAVAVLLFLLLPLHAPDRWRRAALALALATLFGWGLLDARWVATLARQSVATAHTYGGLDSEARHRAAEDADLYAFVQAARAVMPAAPVRMFVAAPADYFRGRAAYHLYPENVYYDPRADTLPPANAMRAGDWLLVYRRPGIAYDAGHRMLRWDGQTHAAELAFVRNGSALFRLL
jgi:hypothetical protein